jgi:phosphopantothenoylcysteine decarboxylase/phosphopantothenate--cysteine ligase
MIRGANILVGVTGSIAAYKSALLIRHLIKEGANVKVIMSPAAKDFISPLTLSTLSKNPVNEAFFDSETGEWTSHVDLGLWANLFVIAPATANTMAKFAHGICEDLLSATYLSARCPVLLAPAMDMDMYRHQATIGNIQQLKAYGNIIIEADHGELASGLIGEGRMAEPEAIVSFISNFLHSKQCLTGKKVLITAGPTQEPIDPIRYIGNHSSGKMGYAIAAEIANRGAKVHLISGPTNLQIDHPNIERHMVNTAEEMFANCERLFQDSDITVLAAAVSDYKPTTTASEKIKKSDESLQIQLKKTVDIAANLGRRKKEGQFIVGFALESENELANARSKLHKKAFDLIVLNSIRDAGAGFGHNTNKVTIIDKNEKMQEFGLKPKDEVATDIVDEIVKQIHA